MPSTRTIANTRIHFDNVGDLPVPCGLRSRRPPSDGLKAEYVAYTKESRNILDNHRISNVIEFIERTNHRLNHNDWVVSTLEHIRDEQQELLINALHQMNFEDLVSNIHRQRGHHDRGPLVRHLVPLSDSPSSESEVSSSPISQRDVPRDVSLPRRTRSSSIVNPPSRRSSTPHSEVRTMTIEETPRSLPTPPPPPRHYRNNRAQVIYSHPLTHSGTSSSRRQGSGDSFEDSIDVDLSTEQAFGLSVEQVIEATDQAERQEVIDGYPLSPSHPRYHSSCYQCRRLGHIHINCEWYQCPDANASNLDIFNLTVPLIAPLPPL
ncbi:hypothetical protein PAXINDRAFT_12145 [Paxillus involutus ATCC 200175]|uniref:Uncharacterized protein n=1 Tax=Paxillus involutus ATCC 200175 TaxID=664439 RepID=A0A0C9U826_PAXIN|nr:hypothetical protein PAXINDRAFT_12145 [Paxillus involutus ATCC 200175]